MFSLIFRSICRSTTFAFSTQVLQEYIKSLLLQWSTKSHRPNATSTESALFIKISLEQMLLSAPFVQFLPLNFCTSNTLFILELKNSISTQKENQKITNKIYSLHPALIPGWTWTSTSWADQGTATLTQQLWKLALHPHLGLTWSTKM